MSKVTLSMVYEEVKKLNKRMEFIEDLVEEIIVNELPKIKLSKEEIEKIKDSLEEMRKGNYVTLKELVNA